MADFFKDKVFHNTSLKVFSLIFALVFWIYVMDQVNPVITKTFGNVKVELLNVSAVKENGLVFKNNKEFFVDVTVEGRRDEVLQFSSSDLSLTSNLMGYQSGINTIPVNSKSNNNDVKIINQSLDEIKVEFENYIERAKPIEVTFEGKLPENYKIASSQLGFKEAYVSGAASKVNSVVALVSDYTIDGLKSGVSEDITIAPVDSEGNIVQGVTLDQKYVNISLTIVKEKQVAIVVEFIDNTSDNYNLKSYDYNPKEIILEGDEDLMNAIDQLTLEPIEVEDDFGDFSFEREIILPIGIGIAEGSPTVNIFGEVEPVIKKNYVYKLSNIIITNLDNSDYETEILDNASEIVLQITGPESLVEDIQKEEISLLIDGSNFELGPNNARVYARFNEESYDYQLSKETLTILLKEKNDSNNNESEGN